MVVIHIGEPKTGTTFLQQIMFANREVLAEQGMLIPGPRPMFHWRAAQDLCEVAQIANDPVGPFQGAWDRMVRQALRAPRVGVVSHELLSSASAEQASRAVQSFAEAGADVHVALTVRDMGSLLPAEWQETVKHRNARGWRDWLGDVIDAESGAEHRRQFWFWRVHDTAEILRHWGVALPADKVHVITVPPRGADPTMLWRRFASLIEVDSDSVKLDELRANASLGLAEVELLRRLNIKLTTDIPNWFYMWHVKEALAHNTLSQREKNGLRLELPAGRDGWARDHAEALIADLRVSGYDVIGDLNDLIPRPPDGPRAAPADADPEEMVAAGIDAIVTLLGELAEAKNVNGRQTVTETTPTAGVAALAKRQLIAYSEKHMWAHQVRRQYWRLANSRLARR